MPGSNGRTAITLTWRYWMIIWTRPLRNCRQLWSSCARSLSGYQLTGCTELSMFIIFSTTTTTTLLTFIIGVMDHGRIVSSQRVSAWPWGPTLLCKATPSMRKEREVYLFIDFFIYQQSTSRTITVPCVTIQTMYLQGVISSFVVWNEMQTPLLWAVIYFCTGAFQQPNHPNVLFNASFLQ